MDMKSNAQNPTQAKSHTVLAMALTATIAVLLVFFATLILLQLKFKDPIEIMLSDWLKIIIPIVGGAVLTVFAFLGVDRLKSFDDRQDKLEEQLRSDLKTQVENAVQGVEPRLNKTYQEWEIGLNEKLAKFEDSLLAIENRINRYDKIIGSVEKLEEVTDTIGNVDEAHRFIASLFLEGSEDSFDKSQRTRIIFTLVDRVKNEEIKGDSDDYHNLSSELARHNYYEFAADVTKKGLEFFGDNIDLLSDFTFYSRKAGRKADVSKGIDELGKIEENMWNWRAFTFYIKVLNDGETSDENKEKTLKCVESYKRVLPDDERAYMAEYETLKKYGELEAAEKALLMAESTLTMTAQCSLTLSAIFRMRGEYDKAIESATRAILGQADTQPTSDTGAAFANRGFSRDAKIHKAILDGKEVKTLYSDIHSAICDLKIAMRLGYSHSNVIVRINILQGLLAHEEQNEGLFEDLENRIQNAEFAIKSLLAKAKTELEE